MLAYKCGITKTAFVKEIKLHQKLDHFIQGAYKFSNKGCAVGCSIMSINKLKKIKLYPSDHKQYETYLGIPGWLAYLEDYIFENLPLEVAKKWPLKFSSAIKTGSNLDNIKVPFLVFILNESIKIKEKDVIRSNNTEIKLIKQAIRKLLLNKLKESLICLQRLTRGVELGNLDLITITVAKVAILVASSIENFVMREIRSKFYELLSNKLLELIKECK